MKLGDFSAKTIQGTDISLSEYSGKVVLIVNVASLCGFTPQYAGLQALYEKYRDRGFTILGFPCNQFGKQEPEEDSAIASFCEARFHIRFPLFSKVDVNGANAHPFFQWLKQEAPGILGTQAIKWNFTKFLVNRDGEVVDRFAPNDSPESIAPKIEALL